MARKVGGVTRGPSRETWVVHVVDVVLASVRLSELADALERVKQARKKPLPNQPCVRVTQHESHLQLPGFPALLVFDWITAEVLQ